MPATFIESPVTIIGILDTSKSNYSIYYFLKQNSGYIVTGKLSQCIAKNRHCAASIKKIELKLWFGFLNSARMF